MKVFQFMLEKTNSLLKVYVAANDLHTAIKFIETTHEDYDIKGIFVFEEAFYIALDEDDLKSPDEPEDNK